MATESYMSGRRQYFRPQGLILANAPGYIADGKRFPDGKELEDFIILSDHNRGPIGISNQRIEKRERTVNSRMRSYHIADKITISTDWSLIPSRAFKVAPVFETLPNQDIPEGKIKNLVESVSVNEDIRPVKSFGSPYFKDQQYTSDGGAGGADLLEWYRNNQGSFWVFMSYDNHYALNNERNRLKEYSEVVEVFFASFDYSIESRGGENHDLWSVNMSMEEV